MTRTWRMAAGRVLGIAFVGLLMGGPEARQAGPAERLLQEALTKEAVEQDLEAAIKIYEEVIAMPGATTATVARARERLMALRARNGSQRGGAIVEHQGVWTGDEVDLQGRPSRDGRYITFIDRSGRSNVAVRDLRTGRNRLVTQARTSSDCGAERPALSPDNKTIAYGCATDDEYSIRLVGFDGTRPRVLVRPSADSIEGLVWSPAGNQLAVVLTNKDRTRQIALVKVDDGSLTQLRSTGAETPWLGDFSPDGRWLVFSATPQGGNAEDRDVFAIAVDSGEIVTLVSGAGRDRNPFWTPDGRAVVFVSDRSETNGLWSIRVDRGKPVGLPIEIRPDVGAIDSLGFSRDGVFFYGLYRDERDVFLASVDPETLGVTSAPTRLSERSAGSNSTPHWSPDGRLIAFLRGPSLRSQMIVIRSIADGVERNLPVTLAFPNFTMTYGFSWFPDGRSLLIRDSVPGREGRIVLRRIDVETGKDVVLFEAGQWDVWPPLKLSPDGSVLYYTSFARDTTRSLNSIRLMKRNLTTGEETQLLHRETGAFAFYGLMVSPDSSRLVFLGSLGSRPQTFLTLPASGGTPAELYPSDDTPSRPTGTVDGWRRTWTPDGRYVITQTQDGGVWAFPTDGGRPRKLDWPLRKVGELSPDGRHTVFPVTEERRELRTIPNLLSRIGGAE